MDNLTHSLVGALLGQIGLKRKTGLAMPMLIIAANIPDIDAVTVLLGGQQHLALRRGITHGPIAMVLLPLLLWGAMLWFDRWQTKRGKRPEKRLPVDKRWLLALAFIGCLSHPLFDWFNSYGVRLLEPFSSQWFYGDTLFIVDVWIWAALIAGVWVSLRRDRRGASSWRVPAVASFAAICAYIFANGLITGKAEAQARYELEEPVIANSRIPKAATDSDPRHHNPELLVVANPVPFAFWRREMLWRDGTDKGKAEFSLFATAPDYRTGVLCPDIPCAKLLGPQTGFQSPENSRRLADGSANRDVATFLFWSRMPVLEKRNGKLFLTDQRFSNPLVSDRFRVEVK